MLIYTVFFDIWPCYNTLFLLFTRHLRVSCFTKLSRHGIWDPGNFGRGDTWPFSFLHDDVRMDVTHSFFLRLLRYTCRHIAELRSWVLALRARFSTLTTHLRSNKGHIWPPRTPESQRSQMATVVSHPGSRVAHIQPVLNSSALMSDI